MRERQKSYTLKRRKDFRFQDEDQFLFKCLPRRECYVLAESKLNPPYIGPFEIVERLDQVAFRLDLPVETSRMRSTCHMTNLMAYLAESEWQASVCALGEKLPSSSSSIPLIIRSFLEQGADKAELSSVEAESGKDRVLGSINPLLDLARLVYTPMTPCQPSFSLKVLSVKYEKHFILVQIYVDDIIFGSTNPQTLQKGRNSSNERWSTTLGMRVMKESFPPDLRVETDSKCWTAVMRLHPRTSQKCFNNSKGNPYGPGVLFGPKLQTAAIISSSEKGAS
ncbi:hypothetical protein OSB04_002234 [Centaurea solstitialis]|uniref:Tf2-1-like SH3-like domain-containing protein n=1 Tax=Centaurea solstitialis TaxID=347529 RepID=A0AA38U035_9ASTR|nr:hypothetical protein OSB04_002234 [Centaurea solstitialis]